MGETESNESIATMDEKSRNEVLEENASFLIIKFVCFYFASMHITNIYVKYRIPYKNCLHLHDFEDHCRNI